MKRERKRFLLSLGIYSLVLLVIIVIGLAVLWNFLQAYEKSLPETAMRLYMETHDDAYWRAEVEKQAAEGFGEFADHTATPADYGIDINGKITWTGRAEAGRELFEVRIGNTKVCTLTAEPSASVGFQLNEWAITQHHFDFGKDTALTISAPLGSTVTINGIAVGAEYIQSEGNLSVSLVHDFDACPGAEVYSVSGLRGPIALDAADMHGNELWSEQINDTEFQFVPDPQYMTRFIAPLDAEVLINGTEVGERYLEDAAPELAPDRLGVYEFSELYTEPEITVVWQGNELEPTELGFGTCYVPGGSAEIGGGLAEFVDGFIHAYVDFLANKDRAAVRNFNALAPYLIAGSELYESLAETKENIVWAKTSGLTYHETACYDHIDLGDGKHLCYVSYDVSYVFQGNPRDIAESMALLITETDDAYKVEAFAPTM